MRIRAGYEITYQCPQPTPMILLLNVHRSRAADLETSDIIRTDPAIPVRQYVDGFGNLCSRIVAPAGVVTLSSDFIIRDPRRPDPYEPSARQLPVDELPDDVLVYLLGSRYCETDQLSDKAWSLFGGVEPGWARVQAICDYVHERIAFGYEHARPTKTAFEAHQEGRGVCRDYAHLAITLCRCMNIPTRYCTGYIPDIDVPPTTAPMDFCAWMEVYLSGQWWTFDARNNTPRVGRVLMATGRDATDVAITNSFGPMWLNSFKVICEEATN